MKGAHKVKELYKREIRLGNTASAAHKKGKAISALLIQFFKSIFLGDRQHKNKGKWQEQNEFYCFFHNLLEEKNKD